MGQKRGQREAKRGGEVKEKRSQRKARRRGKEKEKRDEKLEGKVEQRGAKGVQIEREKGRKRELLSHRAYRAYATWA